MGRDHDPHDTHQYLCIEVKDNGSGIDSEDLPRIFDEKVSDQKGTNWDGTGLGLSICLQLSQKLDAFIN